MRGFTSAIAVGVGLLMSMACPCAALAQTPTDFTVSYQGGSGTCGTTYTLQGKEPVSGTHPVFIYLSGTWEPYNHVSALAAVSKMAELGFVAASAQYDNNSFGDCTTLSARARCLFDASSPKSAVAALCSRPKADCSKGIVVGGFSQGSVLSILSKNYDSRVRAVYGMGAGVQYSTYDLRACVADGNRVLTSDRLRTVNGETDSFMGGTESSGRTNFVQLTGLSCTSTSASCFRANGSGWYIVNHAESSAGIADHCYMRQGGCNGTTLDQKWSAGTYDWSLGTNLQWLKTFTQP
jgi:hypothetical protein